MMAGTRSPTVLFGAASLAAVALGALILALGNLGPGSWSRNLIAWAIGLAAALAVTRFGGGSRAPWFIVAAAIGGLAATFAASPQDGVHRWVDAGPLHVNMAALLLPATIVALARLGAWTSYGLAAIVGIALLLVAQPDASQATAFLAGAAILLWRGSLHGPRRLLALAACTTIAAASWFRPDPTQPIPEVEGIFALALQLSPALTLLAGAGLVAASAAPLLAAGDREPRSSAALALTAYMAVNAVTPFLGHFPVPLVGLGMSFPVGYWLGIGLLAAAAPRANRKANADLGRPR